MLEKLATIAHLCITFGRMDGPCVADNLGLLCLCITPSWELELFLLKLIVRKSDSCGKRKRPMNDWITITSAAREPSDPRGEAAAAHQQTESSSGAKAKNTQTKKRSESVSQKTRSNAENNRQTPRVPELDKASGELLSGSRLTKDPSLRAVTSSSSPRRKDSAEQKPDVNRTRDKQSSKSTGRGTGPQNLIGNSHKGPRAEYRGRRR